MFNSKTDFKLLAIRPLKNCSRKYCNNLEPGTVYKFYQYYDFKQKNGNVTEIEKSGSDFDIYNDFIPKDRKLKISLSAIVGKNGSGKSTLVELFYLCAYLVANENGLLPANSQTPSGKRQSNEVVQIKEGLKLEVYYFADEQYRCILMDSRTMRKRKTSNIQVYNLFAGDKLPLADFFYTIAVNYSIYGLNDTFMGPWIAKLFHKNDGYQTPIVINPFRDQGTINVNGEMHFAQTRLLSNIRFREGEINEIIPGKGIKEIAFIINKAKFNRSEGHSKHRIFEELEYQGMERLKIFELVYFAMLGEKPRYGTMLKKDWEEMTIDYVIFKVIRIAKNYLEYRTYYTENSEEKVPCIKNISDYIEALKKDLTHVTLKLRQALNFFRNDPLRLDDERIRFSSEKITIQADLFAERLELNKAKYPNRDPMEFVPIAPFSPRIILEDGHEFHRMSSGEQQFIHSIQGVLYHILNVDSVFNQNGAYKKATYNSINIVFDEIELYFHPEYQRRFVLEILHRISDLYAPNISSINILFLTHSPFILSDIPATNVLRIEDGKIMDGQLPTFAANIHQMLSSSFFMKSTTGDFAKSQYDQILRFYHKVRDYSTQEPIPSISEPKTKSFTENPDEELVVLRQEYSFLREKFVFIIGQIGEKVISGVLKNHLDFIDDKLSIKIQQDLSALKRQLEYQLSEVNRKINGGR